MQKRLLYLQFALIALHLVSWFLPYAFNITPWEFMLKGCTETWKGVQIVVLPMFVIAFIIVDFLAKEKTMVRYISNCVLVAVYALVVVGYIDAIRDHYMYDPEPILALLFSLLLFLYSFLIQKGTSFIRNLILCIMALPISAYLFDLYDHFQIGGWLLSGSFFTWVVLGVLQPFQMPKLN